jgi:hypothetical protein
VDPLLCNVLYKKNSLTTVYSKHFLSTSENDPVIGFPELHILLHIGLSFSNRELTWHGVLKPESRIPAHEIEENYQTRIKLEEIVLKQMSGYKRNYLACLRHRKCRTI